MKNIQLINPQQAADLLSQSCFDKPSTFLTIEIHPHKAAITDKKVNGSYEIKYLL